MLLALVAVTTQVVAAVAVKSAPLIEQPGLLVEKLTVPVPEPPLVYKTTEALKLDVREVFEIESGA